ncbi:EXS family-domain-containing protein [Pelagophyceae sp. CCMP2097]|nr:EXS family-domain-containing protein [Pelagophyceae sp. CCMP2097]
MSPPGEVLWLGALVALYALIAASVDEPLDVFAQLFWRTATTRPPVVLVLVFAGWSWVSWRVRAARMELRLVCGPGGELRPRTVLRGACVMLDAVLVCRLLPFAAAAAFGPERWPAWTLAADALAYAACAAVVLAPPSRPCGADARRLTLEVAEAHAKYGHALALETAAARESLLRATCDSMLAPFAPVTFWHVIVADYATSLAKALGDAHVTACVASSAVFEAAISSSGPHDVWWEARRGPCVASALNASALALSFSCRFFQCVHVYWKTREVKNLWNAAKYATAFPLVYAGHLERRGQTPGSGKAFFCCAILQSTVTFCWDVLMDWGLLKRQAGGPVLGLFAFELRDRASIIFADRRRAVAAYTALVVFNFSLRFVWCLAVFGGSPTRGAGMLAFEVAEVARRTIWALFRIEWEYMHLGLPLAPALDEADEASVELLAKIPDAQLDEGAETAAAS